MRIIIISFPDNRKENDMVLRTMVRGILNPGYFNSGPKMIGKVLYIKHEKCR